MEMKFNGHIMAICILCLGLVMTFGGYKIFKSFLAVAGAISAGGGAAYLTFANVPPNLWYVPIIVGVCCAILGAVIFVKLKFVGVVLCGASEGFLVGLLGMKFLDSAVSLSFNTWIQNNGWLLVGALLAIILGVLSVYVQTFVLITGTSFLGAWGVMFAIDFWAKKGAFTTTLVHDGQFTCETYCIVIFSVWLAVSLIGMGVQTFFFLYEKKLEREMMVVDEELARPLAVELNSESKRKDKGRQWGTSSNTTASKKPWGGLFQKSPEKKSQEYQKVADRIRDKYGLHDK